MSTRESWLFWILYSAYCILKLFILLAIVLVQVTQSWQNLSLQLFIKHMKVTSGNDKQALQERWRRWRRPGGHVDCVISTKAQSTTVINVAKVARKNWHPAFFAPSKTAEFEECHVPALHHPLHQHGQCVLMTEREPMRGPPLHCQQLCHPNNFAPSHLSLPQNMAVEMKVMKIWTIYFLTVLLEFLGKEGVFEYYKTKPLFLNIQCM